MCKYIGRKWPAGFQAQQMNRDRASIKHHDYLVSFNELLARGKKSLIKMNLKRPQMKMRHTAFIRPIALCGT